MKNQLKTQFKESTLVILLRPQKLSQIGFYQELPEYEKLKEQVKLPDPVMDELARETKESSVFKEKYWELFTEAKQLVQKYRGEVGDQ